MQIFNTFPSIDVRSLWKNSKERNPILDLENFYLYASGRSALYHGISCLPFKDRKKILMPAFNCGVEVEALLRAGFFVKYYPVKKNFEIDIPKLLEILDEECGALFIIHYYGFPQPVEQLVALCKENNLFLIEDCAHALYSRYRNRWLGQFGDLAIFSLQKTIPLPNGGGLLITEDDCLKPKRGDFYMDLSLFKSAARSIMDYEVFHKGKAGKLCKKILDAHSVMGHELTESSKKKSGSIFTPSYYDVPRYDYQHSIFPLSKLFLRPAPCVNIVNSRRENYKFLQQYIEFNDKFSMIHKELPEEVCPLCLPVVVDSSDMWGKRLQDNGINVFVFGRFYHPSLNRKDFQDLSFFRERILGLPVHQQLSRNDMYRLSETLNKTIKNV